MENATLKSISTSHLSQTLVFPHQFQLATSISFSPRFSNSWDYRATRTPLRSCPHPISALSRLRRPISTNCAMDDGSTDNPPVMVSPVDPSIAVKKKAAEISPELKGTSIFLVGMKSSVKITLGKLLADALRYYYFDSDNLVEEAAGGASAAKSLRESDEKGFRESETEVLKQLSSMGRLVVCAGNGAVRRSTNLSFLRHGISLWIDIPLEMVAREVIEDQSQFTAIEISAAESYSEVLAQLVVLYNELREGYATADATISLQKVASCLGYDDLDAVKKEDMTLEVLKEIEKLTRVKKMMEAAARPF